MNKQPLILAVETSGRIGSVAIATGEKLLDQTILSRPLNHSAEIFPAAQKLLENFKKTPDQIEHVYVSIGPGSFTGIRIAATIAKIMNLAANIRIVAVDTLDIIASNIEDTQKHDQISPDRVAAILDAKRGWFFAAAYQKQTSEQTDNIRTDSLPLTPSQHWKKILPDCMITAEEFVQKFTHSDPPIYLLGEGLVYYKEKFKADQIHFLDEKYWNPSAAKLARLGFLKAMKNEFADPIHLKPAYMHRPHIKIKAR